MFKDRDQKSSGAATHFHHQFIGTISIRKKQWKSLFGDFKASLCQGKEILSVSRAVPKSAGGWKIIQDYKYPKARKILMIQYKNGGGEGLNEVTEIIIIIIIIIMWHFVWNPKKGKICMDTKHKQVYKNLYFITHHIQILTDMSFSLSKKVKGWGWYKNMLEFS